MDKLMNQFENKTNLVGLICYVRDRKNNLHENDENKILPLKRHGIKILSKERVSIIVVIII